MDAGHIDAARACYEALLKADPLNAQASNNLGLIHHRQGALREAADLFRRAIRIEPSLAQPYVNLGNVLQDERDVEGALAQYDAALRIEPDLASARYSRATTLLSLQRFDEGWTEYEWRWHFADDRTRSRRFPRPRWSGVQDLEGKRILLYAEQGFGDAIQFIRYAPMVAALGAQLIVECPSALQKLFETVDGVDSVLATGEPLPDFDYQIPMMSLPAAFRTSVRSIPSGDSYLSANVVATEHWRSRFAGIKEVLKVGVVWSGNPANAADNKRSIPIEHLAALSRVPGCIFLSLQKGAAAKSVAALKDSGLDLRDFTSELHDFADTAACISALDAVVSVDTAVAHLAGALAKPVFVALPYSADWRWCVSGESTPWYQTMRLFRQPSAGDWRPVIDKMVHALSGGLN